MPNTTVVMYTRCPEDDILAPTAINHILVTTFVISIFMCTKSIMDHMRRISARVTVVIIGAGPIGLTTAQIAARSGCVNKIIVYEESSRKTLTERAYQIAINHRNVLFLKKIGIDFDNMEGCWEEGTFFTRCGIFLDYMISILHFQEIPIEIKWGTKFAEENIKEVDNISGRVIVIACDGVKGVSPRLLGLTDEFEQHSCHAYGAVCSIDRTDQNLVPVPEKRIHNVVFDLAAYGIDSIDNNEINSHGFTVKLFGSLRQRHMALFIQRCESKLLKALKVSLNSSIIRNIFLKCFNCFKDDSESSISENASLRTMKFSPRLFEIKYLERLQNVTYYEDTDTFVLVEGAAARSFNIYTGLDVNFSLKSLMSLPKFLSLATCAEYESMIIDAMQFYTDQSDRLGREIQKFWLRDYVYT